MPNPEGSTDVTEKLKKGRGVGYLGLGEGKKVVERGVEGLSYTPWSRRWERGETGSFYGKGGKRPGPNHLLSNHKGKYVPRKKKN